MLDISNSDFLAALNNTTVAACFTSSATLPSSVTPVQVLDSLLEAYREVQNEVNEASTGTSFINTIVSVRNEPILFDEEGKPFMDAVSTVRIKKVLTTLTAYPYAGGSQLI